MHSPFRIYVLFSGTAWDGVAAARSRSRDAATGRVLAGAAEPATGIIGIDGSADSANVSSPQYGPAGAVVAANVAVGRTIAASCALANSRFLFGRLVD